MVNTQEFTKRLHEVMEYYELSAASFADKIDVGRSSISHLLSGRNKPSLDFVMKIINAFPEVELYWLLNGKGSFPTEKEQSSPSPIPSQSSRKDLFAKEEISEGGETSQGQEIKRQSDKKEIKKIVFFYTDGSFEAFDH
ncbi:helix-turn-helix domain-containing protein [Salinimicrobium sp. GXAS 041]|uniref:helix-turn-helix domain-containing protein n=1 Tax=Salinimicrobium sp. GXAS 041 TaxID=3400806 RepID=UPI003C761111